MNLFQIDHLVHFYRFRPALAIEHWSVRAGSITGLTGPNGSGKSTLLRLLGLIERPSRGEIRFQGLPADLYAANLRSRIALLPQDSFLLRRSVCKNVAYGLRIRNQKTEEEERVRQALDLVGLDPGRFADRPWYALSGGEARRVALAARLALRPQVLLLDEPTASVDEASAHLMKEAVLKAHQQWDTSLIIASHDLPWLQEVCDQMVHLLAGRLLGDSRRTLLFGPWQEHDQGHWCMALGAGQLFVAARPGEGQNSSIAAVDPETLSISMGAPPENKKVVEGLLTGISFDRRSGRTAASVLVGRTFFNLYLASGEIAAQGLIPGRGVKLLYDPEKVQWH